MVTLPFVDGGVFSHGLSSCPDTLLADHVNVGDRELYGKGIGTRLLEAAFQHAVSTNPHVTKFRTGWARLGLINTTVRILGIDNVGVNRDGKRFG